MAYYTQGQGLISQRRGNASYFYHYDGLGSTKALTDANQNIQAGYKYDAWGNVLQTSGTVTNPYLYVGELGYYGDGDSGMYLLTQRWYNPVVGRFVVRDPIEGEVANLYIYALCNPINIVDPVGLAGVLVNIGSQSKPVPGFQFPSYPKSWWECLKAAVRCKWEVRKWAAKELWEAFKCPFKEPVVLERALFCCAGCIIGFSALPAFIIPCCLGCGVAPPAIYSVLEELNLGPLSEVRQQLKWCDEEYKKCLERIPRKGNQRK